MGMMLNRRRVCGGKKEDTYIQDGLVFQLDGIESGNQSDKWMELKQNIPFTLNANVERTKNGKGFYFGDYAAAIADSEPTYPTTFTVEFVVNYLGQHGAEYGPVILGSPKGHDVGPYIRLTAPYHSGFPESWKIRQDILYAASSHFGTISISSSRGFQNLQSLSSTLNRDGYGAYVATRIHSNAIGHWFELYAVRIYNRILTSDEVLFNQRLDNKRFDLGLTV